MAKKSKPSLKDVSSFLKKKPHTLTEVKRPEEGLAKTEETKSTDTSRVALEVSKTIKDSKQEVGQVLVNVIIETLENENDPTPEEIMLLNTAYFLNYSRNK